MTRNILILGSGVGGLRCAFHLADLLGPRDVNIILIDKRRYQLFHGELASVLSCQKAAHQVGFPIETVSRRGRIHFLCDLVTAIDPINRTVTLYQRGALAYDYLVIALGSVPDDHQIPGLADSAWQFNSLEDACQLRQYLCCSADATSTQHWVIAGGGSTGTELAAWLGEAGKSIKVSLIEQNSHLLSGLPHEMGEVAKQQLQKCGIRLFFNTEIVEVRPDSLTLLGGQKVAYDVLIWAGGVKAPALVAKSGFELDRTGRIAVAKTLQARGYSRVYAIGDITAAKAASGRNLPQVATYARDQAVWAANNIIRQLDGKSPLAYQGGRHLVIIGLGYDALVQFGPIVFRGHWVQIMRKLAELWYLWDLLPFGQAWSLVFPSRAQP